MSMQQGRRRSDDGGQRGNAWSGLENKRQEVGSERKSEEEAVPGDFQRSHMKVGVKKLSRAGVVPARTWRVHAKGWLLTERLKLRRQMAAAAGKKGTTSLSLFMEAFGLEVKEDLSTLATQYWAEGVWIGERPVKQKEAWTSQARETRDMGIKWPHWHSLIF